MLASRVSSTSSTSLSSSSSSKLAAVIEAFELKVKQAVQTGNLSALQELWKQSSGFQRIEIMHIQGERKSTLLHIAAEYGHQDIVKFLLETVGADINAADDILSTPLHYACLYGHTNIIYFLLKHGARVDCINSSSKIPLNYFLNKCKEPNRLLVVACLTLLIPSIGYMRMRDGRNETLLHSACANQCEWPLCFFVNFLLLNGVDPYAQDKHGQVCWNYIQSEEAKQLVSSTIDMTKYKPIPLSVSLAANPIPELRFRLQYQDEEGILIQNLVKMRQYLEAEPSQSENIGNAITRLETCLQLLRPAGATSSLHRLQKLGSSFCIELLKEQDLELSNRTARKLKSEGKLMVCVNEAAAENVYYFLFNDVLLLFEDNSIRMRAMDQKAPAQLLRVIPLSGLLSYPIPEGLGIAHGMQLVFYPFDERVRQSFTVLLPSAEDKESFRVQLEAALNTITTYYISQSIIEVPDPEAVIHEGFLIKKGVVLNNYVKVYVRLTKQYLYYYEHPNTPELLGKICLEKLTFKMNSKHQLLRWCNRNGRSYCFQCVDDKDFDQWRLRTQGLNDPHKLAKFNDKLAVKVKIVAGRDLVSMDANGKSDPYCKIGLAAPDGKFMQKDTVSRTPIEKKTLMPTWTTGNEFPFAPVIDGVARDIRLEVWDDDKLSADDFMGMLFITPPMYSTIGTTSGWFPLHGRRYRKDEFVTGDLYLEITVSSA